VRTNFGRDVVLDLSTPEREYSTASASEQGEAAAAALVKALGAKAEVARELAYRLYTLCERKKRATEALSYNSLVQSWPEIMRLAREAPAAAGQGSLFDRSDS
jgi:putative DNA methylase